MDASEERERESEEDSEEEEEEGQEGEWEDGGDVEHLWEAELYGEAIWNNDSLASHLD